MPGYMGKAFKFARTPEGRKVLSEAIRLARTDEGRKLIAQAKKVASSPEGRRLLANAAALVSTPKQTARNAQESGLRQVIRDGFESRKPPPPS
jgi:ribosomal protein L34